MLPSSPSYIVQLSDIALLYIKPADCFVDRGSEGVCVDKDKLTRLTQSLCFQIMRSNHEIVVNSLNSLKEHIEKLQGRLKLLGQKDTVLLSTIKNILDNLRKDYPTALQERASFLKELLENVRKQRKADPRLKYIPVLPEDLYSKIWSLTTPEEKKAIFPQACVPLNAKPCSKTPTPESTDSPRIQPTLSFHSYLHALRQGGDASATQSPPVIVEAVKPQQKHPSRGSSILNNITQNILLPVES